MEPAEVTLPPYINEISFINRSYVPTLFNSDTMVWTAQELFILDTIVNNRIFLGITDALNESPLFDLTMPSILQNRRHDTIDFMAPLYDRQLQQVRRAQTANALISLEFYHVEDRWSARDMETYYTSSLQMVFTTYWKIYDLVKDTILWDNIHLDSITWESYGDDFSSAIANLPEMVNALRESGYQAGYTFGRKISPNWLEEPRFYHIMGSMDLQIAAELAELGQWDAAAGIWTELAEGDNRRSAARACFNMALFCEMEDRLIPAIEWALQSYLLKQSAPTKEYIKLLQSRYETGKELKKQLPPDE